MYNPKFIITNKILKNIGIIEASREVIDHAPLLPYYEKQFRKDALIRTVHYGTHIEGNELNLDQAEKVLAGQDVVARDRDIQEVINYRKAIEFISEIRIKDEGLRINEETIRKLHKITVNKILPSEKCGEYRKTQVVVKNNQTGQVSFRPPEASTIPSQIKDLLVFIESSRNQDIHPVLKGGIVHYELVRIHPFLDGNGRVGRALSMLVLYKLGYDIRQFFSLEEHFDRDPERYYEALQSIEKNNGDQTEWLSYFTECLAAELSKIKDRIENISIDSKLKKKLGGPVMLSDRQLKIIEYIQANGYIENKAYDTLFPMVSEDTVLREVQDLVKKGLLKKQGVTKGVKYIMTKD